jgi:hypothetical protein
VGGRGLTDGEDTLALAAEGLEGGDREVDAVTLAGGAQIGSLDCAEGQWLSSEARKKRTSDALAGRGVLDDHRLAAGCQKIRCALKVSSRTHSRCRSQS